MTTTVTEEQAGTRLDSLVAASMPRLSRAYVHKLSVDGCIQVNGVVLKAGYKVRLGDKVVVDYDEAELDIIPEVNIPILYEDDDCVVMNKPAGVLTHTQGALNPEGTVATFLRARLSHDMEGERAGVVHRLDRATSGVIIGAKNQAALSWLQKQFAQRRVKKIYVAIVQGHVVQKKAVIDMPIERNPKAPATFRVGANGKRSITEYGVLEENGNYSLLELKPETGRTHQLRVHLQKIGYPIVGDPLYGEGTFGDRLYLHALSLEITLPNRERKTFIAPLPPEFEEKLHG